MRKDADRLDELFHRSTNWWDQKPMPWESRGMGTNPSINQLHFQFGDDDGSESAYTQDSIDTDVTVDVGSGNAVKNVRFELEQSIPNADQNLSYTYEIWTRKNSGTWYAVDDSTNVNWVQMYNSSNLTHGNNCSNRISGSAETFRGDNGVCDTADHQSTAFTWNPATNGKEHTELLFCIEFLAANLSDSDVIDFRVVISGGTALDSYSVTDATATISKGGTTESASVTDGADIGDDLDITVGASLSDGVDIGEDITTKTYESFGGDGADIGDEAEVTVSGSAEDGAELSDSTSGDIVQTASASDGADVSDTAENVATFPESETDGVELGDDLLASLIIPASETDGADIGDDAVGEIVYEGALQDSVDIGDFLEGYVVLPGSITDGADVGDEATEVTTEPVSVEDGLEVGDEVDPDLTLPVSLSDGADVGDDLSGTEAYPESLSDGVDIGDSTSGSVQTGTVQGEVTEGIDVGEDITTKTYESFSGDGVEIGDSVSASSGVEPLSDGVELGEDFSLAVEMEFDDEGIVVSDSVEFTGPEEISDGIEMSDAASYITGEEGFVTEGVDLGDEASGAQIIVAVCTDGFKLSDDIIVVSPADLLDAHLKPWAARWPLFNRPNRNSYDLKPGETFEWGEFVWEDSGKMAKVADVDPTPLFGMALEDAGSSIFPNKVTVLKFTREVKLAMMGYRDPVTSDIGVEYGILKDKNGVWIVDTRDTTNTRVTVKDVILERNLFIVQVMQAHRQGG